MGGGFFFQKQRVFDNVYLSSKWNVLFLLCKDLFFFFLRISRALCASWKGDQGFIERFTQYKQEKEEL